jgi:peptide/nickel transport system permease protein
MNRRELLIKLLRNRRGQIGALIISVIAFFAIFSEWVVSDQPIYVRYQGSAYLLPAITHAQPFADLRADQIAASLGPDDFAVWPPFRVGPRASTTAPPLSGPSADHLLGTDAFGRDVFARLVHGTRTSLSLGALVAFLAVAFGYALGALAGALGGLWDGAVERMVEIIGVFPAVLAVALVRALERRPSILSLVIVITAVKWAEIARLVRLHVLRALAEDWALAAKASGASPARIAFGHITPHLMAPIAVSAVFAVASAVLTETSLSFLDLGVPSSFASWGEMLGEVRWGAGLRILLPPIFALGLTLGGLYLIADAIRKTFEV